MHIAFRPLLGITWDELDRVMPGYVSTSRYAVRKIETRQQTTITVTLEPLEMPYIRRWDSKDDAEVAYYQEVVKAGMSIGAYDGDLLVGLALIERRAWNRTLWVWEFGVLEGYRRQGIGRQLMDRVTEQAVSQSCRVIGLETQSTNVGAIEFYRAAGFKIDGIDLSYYTNHDVPDGEVAIFMKRKIETDKR